MAVCDSLLIMNMIIGLTAHRFYLSLIFSTPNSATTSNPPDSFVSTIVSNLSIRPDEFSTSPAIRPLTSMYTNTSPPYAIPTSELPSQSLSANVEASTLYQPLSLSYFLVLFNPSADLLKSKDSLNETFTSTTRQETLESDNARYKTSLDYHMIETFFEIMLYLVLGRLRESEEHDLMLTARDYLFQKCLFMLLVLDADTFEERFAWERWFRTLGTTLLSAKLCKERFEHLATNSPILKKWQMVKICLLMCLVLFITVACNLSLPALTDFSIRAILLRADASYVLVFVFSVLTRMAISFNSMRVNSSLDQTVPLKYYSDLVFGITLLIIELLHNLLLFKVSGSLIFRGVCSLKLYTISVDLRELYMRHKLHSLIGQLVNLVSVASPEDIGQFNDKCAICWDAMRTARKLPCGHLFHETCLKSWLIQDRSCATCRSNICRQVSNSVEESSLVQRLELEVPNQNIGQIVNQNSDEQNNPFAENIDNDVVVENRRNHQQVDVVPRQLNPIFRFDSSRYINHPFFRWLPSISIEAFM